MPLAGLMLVLVYVQALTGILPLGKVDPLPRLLGRGFRPVADSLPAAARAGGVAAVLTTDYETAAWLRFYQPGLKVIEAGETLALSQCAIAVPGASVPASCSMSWNISATSMRYWRIIFPWWNQ